MNSLKELNDRLLRSKYRIDDLGDIEQIYRVVVRELNGGVISTLKVLSTLPLSRLQVEVVEKLVDAIETILTSNPGYKYFSNDIRNHLASLHTYQSLGVFESEGGKHYLPSEVRHRLSVLDNRDEMVLLSKAAVYPSCLELYMVMVNILVSV